ncbi:MAG: SGNH/GDSL hydrolase family protein [Clostridiales bacterium]|nr:SGNH/GDSL hydrolase family protein [Clostridiales bacterium]
MKKRVLCFGDSLTWGYDPVSCERFDEETRWPCVLQSVLGPDYAVVEEGQNGRTIATDDPTKGEKCGIDYVIPCIESHKPLELMIIMLGTNDIKSKFGYTAGDIADEMKVFLEKVIAYNNFRLGGRMKILLVAPPHIGEDMAHSRFFDKFCNSNAREVSMGIADKYKELADNYGLLFLDSSLYVKASAEDSLHLDADGQVKLGKAIGESVARIV